MNWLAHAYLSPSEKGVRVGNLAADVFHREDIQGLPPELKHGIRLHQIIDRFTDDHPLVQQAHTLFLSPVKRFRGALLDVFFDHFLCQQWEVWSSIPLDDYLGILYADILEYKSYLPERTSRVLNRLVEEDWLGAYATVDGVRLTLERMSGRVHYRTGRDIDLTLGIQDLTANYEEFARAFDLFFPELEMAVKEKWKEIPEK